ncbi:DMT family transporter [Kangiella sp. HZ709]|uniref:DMT family transporter n=1 Tax=Kangiella sp. HZ709 TaxID=2666328 RepID=UPI0012B14C2D|nr:DMT family transporter [Kangiella sp. HZ709]MRX27252.1 EamA family transporter [Kangiella sp. HZ709]
MIKLFNSTLFLYIFTVLVWGSTWFTIEYQLGVVPHEYSSFYRFISASLILFAYCFYRKLNLKFSLKHHFWMLLLGLTLFSFNYIMVYEAQEHLTSAMASVIFSAILIVNIFNSWLFFRTPISKEVIIGAIIGLTGIVLIFWKDIGDFSFENKALYGLVISLLGVLAASIGNMVSVQTQKYQLPVMQMNAYAMGYGALLSLLIGLVQGKALIYDTATSYSISMIYLSLFGSVLAFGAYLTLLRRIGIHKATYVVVMFPAVALLISTFFEDFVWTWPIAIGIILIGIGNLFVVNRKDLSKKES